MTSSRRPALAASVSCLILLTGLLPGTAAAQAEGPRTAEQWLGQAQAQRRAGEPLAAWDSAGRAVALHQAQWGPADRRTLEATAEWAGLCGAAGQARACEAPVAAALPLYEALARQDPANLPGLAAFLRSRSSMLNGLGRFDEALAALRQAAALLRPLGAEQAERLEAVLYGQGVVLQNLGRYAESLAVLDELLQLQTARLGADADATLGTAGRRADVLSSLGHSREAVRVLQQVVQARRERLGEDHVSTLDSTAHLATALIRIGQAPQAVQVLMPAIAAGTRKLGPTQRQVMDLRIYLVSALLDAGLAQQSLEEARRLVPDLLQAYGDSQPDYAIALSQRATALSRVGETQAAQASATDAVAAMKRAYGNAEHPAVISLEINAGSMALDMGQPLAAEAAQAVALRALATLGADDPVVWSAQSVWARALLAQGDLPARQAALAVLRPMAAARLASEGALNPAVISAQVLLARALARTGHADEALALFDAVQAPLEAERRNRAVLGADAQREVSGGLALDLAERIVLLAEAGRVDEAWAAMETHKARTLLAQLGQQRAIGGAGLPAAQREQLQAQVREIAALAARTAEQAPGPARDALSQRLLDLRREQGEALAAAQAAYPLFARLLDLGAAHSTNQAQAPDGLLRPGMAAVHFLQATDERWFALVKAHQRPARWIELGPLNSLGPRIDAWVGGLGTAADEADQAARLGEQLLTPLLPALAGVQDLLIAPDGVLALLPWDALRVRGQRALQRWRISQTPSLAVLQASRRMDRLAGAKPGRGLLALAAPDAAEVAGQLWPALPFAAYEARAAAALFTGQHSRALVGAQASEGVLRGLAASGELAQYRYLLLAAHGRFDASDPARHALLLAGDPARPGPVDVGVDGLVTAADWLGLPLRTELVVLSACDTARGSLVAGEGLVGFAYALNLAGNQNLLASLWPVHDAASAQFVLDFLRRVRVGGSLVQALTATKRAFAAHPNAQMRSPRTWAAYTLIGQ